jgi:dihydrodipicolinate synthase/N-acetylneuraminate lyase
MTAKTIAGVLPVFQTPYNDDESIDFGTLDRHLEWLFELGADGITMAMVSELLRLSDAERRLVAEAACKHVDKGIVVISVGAECALLAEEFARHAEGAGADAVMAIPPVSIAVGEDELRAYYERIVAAISIPVIVQDASGYVGKPMSIELQAGLQAEHGADRILFKPEAAPIGPRLTEMHQATRGTAQVFEGSGGIALVESHRRGIVGTMPGGEIVDAIVALWRALESGDQDRAYQLSFPIASLIALQQGLDGFIAVEKYLLVKRGVFKNAIIRRPVGFALDTETAAEVDRLYERVQRAVTVSG